MSARFVLGVLALVIVPLGACAIPPAEPGGGGGEDDPPVRIRDGGASRVRADGGGGGGDLTPRDGGAPAPSPDGGPPAAPPGGNGECGMTDFEAEVFRLTNEERASAGFAPYACHPVLTEIARAHSKDMCDRNFMGHTNPDGEAPWDRIRAAGLRPTTSGENVAAGQSSPSSVMRSWMGSSGHRANILRSSFTSIGVGHSPCRTTRFGDYWTQLFAAGL